MYKCLNFFPGKDLNAEFVGLDTLLSQSDFIVLSVPLNEETTHMINRTTIAKMKKNAIIVNVGRGGKTLLFYLHKRKQYGLWSPFVDKLI